MDDPDWAKAIGGNVVPKYRQRRTYFEGVLAHAGPLNFPLLPIQKKSVANAAALKYSALFDDMGLGKTAQALAVDALGQHRTTLVLCPNNVKKVWAQEIAKFTDYNRKHIFEGKGRDLLDVPPSVIRHFRYFIFNYEALNVADKARDVIPAVLRQCTHHILDEVHAMRNAEAKKTMYYELMLKNCPPDSLTLLSGTPVDRFIGELYPYLSFLDKNPHVERKNVFNGVFPNATVFADRYGLSSDRSGAVGLRGYSGARNDGQVGRELYQLMGPRFCQRKIEEVVSLPTKTVKNIMIPDASFTHINMEEVREEFKKAFWLLSRKKGLSLNVDEDGGKGLSGDLLFMAKTQKIRRDIANAKVPYTLGQAIQYRNSSGPVIVFSEFLSPLDMFEANAIRGGFKCLRATGQQRMSQAEREDNIMRFKKGDGDFLLATYGAMSEGENLQDFHTLVYNDQSWQPLVMQQSERRIWRIGQESAVTILHILCSADETILNSLQKKREMIRAYEGLLARLKTEYDLK